MKRHTFEAEIETQFGYPTFTFQDEGTFSKLQYKMISDGQIYGLLESRLLTADGQRMLVFLTEKYRALRSDLERLHPTECVDVIKSILTVIQEVDASGFLKVQNVLLDRDFLFFNEKDGKTYLLYLPLENGEENRIAFLKGLLEFINEIVEATSLSGYPDWVNRRSQLWGRDISIQDFAAAVESAFKQIVPFGDSVAGKRQKNANGEVKKSCPILESVGVRPQMRIPIDRSEFHLGRSRRFSDYDLGTFPMISKKHCVIQLQDGSVMVTDVGSSNGTFIDGKWIRPGMAHPLVDGCMLELSTIKFIVRIAEK